MTEKDYNPERRNKKMVAGTLKENTKKIPVQNKEEKKIEQKEETKKEAEEKKDLKEKNEQKTEIEKETKKGTEENKETSEKPEEKKKPIVKKEIVKKEEVNVNGKNIPVSTKHSMAICKFIKGKEIQKAIEYLEKVVVGKKAIPMKGEIPHRKGKMMSGRFPKNASIEFVRLLKSVEANARNNDILNPIVTEAFANIGARPFGRFGRTRKKRSHITIKCREKKEKSEKQNKEKK